MNPEHNMRKKRLKIPQHIVRKIQIELGIVDNQFVKYVDTANVIAAINGWPQIFSKQHAKEYISRYLAKSNQVKITNPLAYVYFAQAGNFIKIGVAVDIQKRLKTIQTGNPHRLNLLAHIPAKSKAHAYEIEGNMHKKFMAYRCNGEWFSRRMIPKMLDIREEVVWVKENHAAKMVDMKLNRG